jgi:hypothetical protein
VSRATYLWRSDELILETVEYGAPDGGALPLSCEHAAPVREEPIGVLDVGGSVWFARAQDCARALKTGQAVAAHFGKCDDHRPASQPTNMRAGVTRLQHILRHGGGLYALEKNGASLQCTGWEVNPTRAPGQRPSPKGNLRPASGGPSFTYEWSQDVESKGGLLLVSGASQNRKCLEVRSIQSLDRESVMLSGRWYLTPQACERVRDHQRARLQWFPRPAAGSPPAVQTMELSSPLGC